jgi:hypothetical protein
MDSNVVRAMLPKIATAGINKEELHTSNVWLLNPMIMKLTAQIPAIST